MQNNNLKFKILLFLICFAFFALNFAFALAADPYKLLVPLPGLGSEIPAKGGLATYIGWLFTFALSAAAFLAVLMIVIGGIQIVVGGASESARKNGKDRIWAAIWGLLLAICAWLILYTINPDLVKGTFELEEAIVKAPPPASPAPTTPPAYSLLQQAKEACQPLCPSWNGTTCKPTDSSGEGYKNLIQTCKSGSLTNVSTGGIMTVSGTCPYVRNNVLQSLGNLKDDLILTAGIPPLGNHKDMGHCTGSCIDVVPKSDPAFNCKSLREKGFSVVIEPPGAWANGIKASCPGATVGGSDYTTGQHFHICK